MNNYPLFQNKKDWRLLEPINSLSSEEYISSHYDLYLTTEYAKNKQGHQCRYYRLNAVKPHSIEMALAYNIKCPHCGHNHLKQIGRSRNHYTLGLYECPACGK